MILIRFHLTAMISYRESEDIKWVTTASSYFEENDAARMRPLTLL